jgi:hypothetical protein
MNYFESARSPTAVWYDWVQRLEREQPLRSCLGAGCCPECGADPCDCDDGELMPWLVKWRAGFAEKRAVVLSLTK